MILLYNDFKKQPRVLLLRHDNSLQSSTKSKETIDNHSTNRQQLTNLQTIYYEAIKASPTEDHFENLKKFALKFVMPATVWPVCLTKRQNGNRRTTQFTGKKQDDTVLHSDTDFLLYPNHDKIT